MCDTADMDDLPAPLKDVFDTWPENAARMARHCRTLFLEAARAVDAGPLSESLKWGQPAWRPAQARVGSTLRIGWNAETPGQLALFVDCKTDLATRMRAIHPDLAGNDGRRRLALDLAAPVPRRAVSHLAEMTFTYHRTRRQIRPAG
jgi:hypothetical protein